MLKSKQAIISPKVLQGAHKLPQSWKRAAGMMGHHKRDMERYVARVRKEWK